MKIAKMKLLSVLLALIGVYACFADNYADRQCGTDLTKLWLDVIAVVDNSQGMTNDGLNNVAANILSVFSSGTKIGSNAFDPQTTRLGLVTYNSAATQKADLNQYQSIDDAGNGIFDALSTAVDTTESYLATGLTLADKMFNDQSENTARAHYKRVVIVYASEYKGTGELDPLPVANRLKLSGIDIITVAYEQLGDDGLVKGLSLIASPGFSFSNDESQDTHLVKNIRASLLQSNCYCPPDWIQYRGSYSDLASSRYGVCIQVVNLQATWFAAKLSCMHRWNVSSLATEFTQAKHDFILDAVKATQGLSPPYNYHIGLNYVSGSWVWTPPTGRQPISLQQPYMWLPGNPQAASDKSGVMNQQKGLVNGWQNIGSNTGGQYNYVCETYSCDTENYCDAQDNKKQ